MIYIILNYLYTCMSLAKGKYFQWQREQTLHVRVEICQDRGA